MMWRGSPCLPLPQGTLHPRFRLCQVRLSLGAGVPLPKPCFLPGIIPGPWEKVGRVPGEEVVIFLNDFKG